MTTLGNLYEQLGSRLEEPVRQHLKNVYACLALSTVSAGVGAYIDMVSSLSFSGLLSAVVGVFLLLALNSTPDNGKNRQLRMSYLLGFSFCSGLGMGSLLDYAMMVDPKIIVTALVSTATIFVCFTMAALTARRGRWLYLGGTLMSFLSILIILSFANIFFGSQLLFQGYLYLGLLLMCGFILYDTQLIIEKRRYGNKDFILHSVDLFVDLLGIFRRLLLILTQKEQKKKSRKD